MTDLAADAVSAKEQHWCLACSSPKYLNADLCPASWHETQQQSFLLASYVKHTQLLDTESHSEQTFHPCVISVAKLSFDCLFPVS
jgi:hypothetical protein